MNPPQISRTWILAWAVAVFFGILILVGYVLTSSKPPFYDESWYLAQAASLNSFNSFREWLLAEGNGPTGPVHALLHYGLSGGRGFLDVPWVRLPNLILLLGMILLTAMHLRTLRIAHYGLIALVALAVPMLWVLAGMALTEMSAMVGISMALYAAGKLGVPSDEQPAWSWLASMIAIGVAVAVCGRQTYLLTLPAIVFVAMNSRKGLTLALAGVSIGLLPALWLFFVWGGLVPPQIKSVVGEGLKGSHGLLAIGYTGVTALVIAPGFLMEHWRKTLPLALGCVVLNSFAPVIVFNPAASLQLMIGNEYMVQLLLWLANQIFIVTGVVFIGRVAIRLWVDPNRLFAAHAFGVLALCISCVAISHQYSSRYVGMGIPFLVPMLAEWITIGPWMVVRSVAGMAVGAAILHSYYIYS